MSSSERRSKFNLALDELVCPMCISTFVKPRSLLCLHSYCEDCLVRLQRASLQPGVVICPECRAETSIGTEGIKDLPLNFKLVRLVEILTAEERQKIVRCSTRRARRQLKPPPLCTTHQDRPLEYFCQPCSAVICGQCMIDEHRVHGDVKYLKDMLQDHVMDMKKILPDTDEILANGVSRLSIMKQEPDRLDACLDKDLSYAASYFETLHAILKEKEESVLLGLKSQAQKRKKVIMKHVDFLAEAVEGLERSKEDIEDMVDVRSKDVSFMFEEDQLRAHFLASMHKVEEEVLNSEATEKELGDLTPFIPNPKIEELCRSISFEGKDTPLDSVPYSKVENLAEKLDIKAPPSYHRTSAFLGLSPKKHHARPTCKTFSGMDYKPRLPLHSDSLSLSQGRSATLTRPDLSFVLEPFLEIGTKNLIGPYNNVTAYPCGVCSTAEGTLLITDTKHHLFRFVTYTGKCLETVGAEGKSDGQFFEPTGITIDGDGNILVVDGKNPGRVQKFSFSGKFMSKFRVRALTLGTYIGEPLGVVALNNGNILVTDGLKSCVHIYDNLGKYQGKFGNDLTDLKYPAGIAANDNRVAIADKSNHCIYLHTLYGQFLAKLGKQGPFPGDLSIPYGVAIDKLGNIIVSESGNHRISIFTSGGKYIRSFGSKGSKPGLFHIPRHICFNHREQLVVCDEQNQRLQIFDLSSLCL